MQVSLSILVAAFLAGCAAAGIRPSYLLAPQYQHLTCSQIASEADRVSQRAMASFVAGGRQAAADLERLRAEFEALDRVSVAKNCNLQLAPRG
ncbi:MAG TPA: hypothetical protein VG758_01260 [Hyphomicrobiaceae bacterium]|jgi:hypothetical protein|nr:hypothetical protein [Hyphomicrobiaceae bacterium]